MNLENDIRHAFELQLSHKYILKNTSTAYRVSKLKLLKLEVLKLQLEIENALKEDFGKENTEGFITEIIPTLTMLNLHIKKLKKWMKPVKVKSSLMYIGTRNYIRHEGKGNCLIISPWNYPFLLAIQPLITAFAAGNTVILKPSEFTPATNQIIEKLTKSIFSPEEVSIIVGVTEASTLLLEKPFDHIFFTGSTPVGKIVMEKASKHLASVSLELGGKSPVIIDEGYDEKIAAKNIAWGKLVNAGQTCVAPDYVLIASEQKDNFVKELKINLTKMYENDFEDNKDYCRIITPRHATRLKSLIDDAISKGATLEYGGELFENGKLMPTILSHVNADMKIMQEEIFGPILPIVECAHIEKMGNYINQYDNALALYMFSNNKQNIEYIRKSTNSGAMSINETLMHVGHINLPFGGAGKSGIGRYHGKHGFEELSNIRAILHRKFDSGTSFLYPPYDVSVKVFLDKFIRLFNSLL